MNTKHLGRDPSYNGDGCVYNNPGGDPTYIGGENVEKDSGVYPTVEKGRYVTDNPGRSRNDVECVYTVYDLEENNLS